MSQSICTDARVDLPLTTMYGDLCNLVVDELKATPDVWQKLSEDQQTDLICRGAVFALAFCISFEFLGGLAGGGAVSAAKSKSVSKRKKADAVKAAVTEPVVIAFKGFDQNWKCRDYQYAVGQTFEHKGEVAACASGLHACEYPLDVFSYYSPAADNGTLNRFALVEATGEISRHGEDSKIAAARLTVKMELNLADWAGYAVSWIMGRIDSTRAANEYRSIATNTGNRSASTNTGNRSASTNTGDCSASTNTGNWSASTNTGNWSASTNTGNCSASTNTGNRSASTNTGDRSASTNTGDRSASTNTGDRSASSVEGTDSVAIATGLESRAMAAKEGSAIVVCNRDNEGKLRHIRAGIVGRDGLKPGTWYVLNDAGEFEEVQL